MDKDTISVGKRVDWRKQVVASLEYGYIFTKSFIGFVYGVIIFLVASAICVVTGSIYFNDFDVLYPFLGTCCLFLCLFSIIPIYHIHILKKIKLFCGDAVELKAESTEIGSYHRIEGLIVPTTRKKISIKFMYNGKKYLRESGQPGYNKPYMYNTKAGYEKIFAKYSNRIIRILYSPKYDQVLILKDEKKAKEK